MRKHSLSTLVSGVPTGQTNVRGPSDPRTSVGEDDGTQKPFHRECFYVTGTRLSLITTSSPLVTVFDWEVVMEERVVPGFLWIESFYHFQILTCQESLSTIRP